jgi:hypothetical protein
VYIYDKINNSILLRMRNVSDRSCRENKKTHFMFNNIFLKVLPFMRKCGIARQVTDYINMAHAYCLPDH